MHIGLFARSANPVRHAGVHPRARHRRRRARLLLALGSRARRALRRVPVALPVRRRAGASRCRAKPACSIPFSALSFLAAVTRTIRLGTGICLVPQRNPVYTAKEVAAVDWLSNGRFDFGVGVGWLAEEFQALGVPFERRAARCRAYLEVMRRCWCDPISQYEGEFYSLPACRHYPEADPAAASADLLRRRERPGAEARRRSRPGLVPVQHRARRARRRACAISTRCSPRAGRTRSDIHVADLPVHEQPPISTW